MKNVRATLESGGWIKDCRADIPDLTIAYNVQEKVIGEMANARGGVAGYKIAFNAPALMQQLGVDAPGFGWIFGDQVFQSGKKLAPEKYRMFMIEPEIAAELGADVPPGTSVTSEDANSLVKRYFPAFELLDRRNLDGMMHVPTLIAHNIFNAGIVCGGPGLKPEEILWDDVETTFTDNNEIVVQGSGIAPQYPPEAVAEIINHFSGRGHKLQKGALLLLGAHSKLYEVRSGRDFRLDLGALGEVGFCS